ncbi:MAG: leucine-rich repeat domain-containing protein [Limisphaerales bacterium]
MHRTLSALSGLLMLAAAAAQAQSSNGYGYMVNAGNTNTVTITNYTGPGGALTIPTNLNNLLVTSIGNSAFKYCTNLTSVTIPSTVTTIGDHAFYFCTNMTSVTILGPVAAIGDYAFAGCASLTNATFPSAVTTIGQFAFYFCTSLTNAAIPRATTNIGQDAFCDCTGLTAITVDTNNSFYSSVNGVLFDKNQFTLIEFPGGVGGSYTIPGTVTSIGSEAFEFCTNLTSVTIPGGVTNIGDEAFEYCTGLTNAAICNGVTTIGEFAFYDCTSLTCVTIPASVTSVGNLAFYFCTSLTNIYFKGNAPAAAGVDVFYDDDSATVYYLPGATGWSYAFWGFPEGPPAMLWNPLIQAGGPSFGVQGNQFGFNITNTANANLTVMVEVCANLASSVWFPLQIVTLTNGSFYFSEPVQTNCSARFYRLALPCAQSGGTLDVTITPSAAVSAGAEWQVDGGAWQPSGAMAEVSAGAHTVQFTNIAGWNAPSNQIVTITNGFLTAATANYTAQEQQSGPFVYLANAGAVTIISYSGPGGAVTIPSTINGLSVTSIGQNAFQNCSNLTSVTLPAGVTNIGTQAFYECGNLTSIYFYGNAPADDSTVFSGDNHVTGYYLPGTTGWSAYSAVTGIPTTAWMPLLQATGPNFGIVSNQFGFNVIWANGPSVGVDVCTNLGSGGWTRLQTFTLTNGVSQFKDPLQPNSAYRFYRVSAP